MALVASSRCKYVHKQTRTKQAAGPSVRSTARVLMKVQQGCCATTEHCPNTGSCPYFSWRKQPTRLSQQPSNTGIHRTTSAKTRPLKHQRQPSHTARVSYRFSFMFANLLSPADDKVK